MTRVAIVVPTLSVGGAENLVVQLTNSFDLNRFSVLLVVVGPPTRSMLEERVNAQRVEMLHLNKPPGLRLRSFGRMARALEEFRPDVVHTHLSAVAYVLPWAVLRGVTVLHTVHNVPARELPKSIRRVLGWAYRRHRAIPVAISKEIALETAALYRVPISRLEMVANPVDMSRYLSARVRAPSANSCVFVTVGRLTMVKNQAAILRSLAVLKRTLDATIVLKVVGDGEERTYLESLADHFGLRENVVFTGNINDVERELENADVFVLASTYEGLPLAVLEAMASGLPIIATRTGGLPEVVQDNGILINPRDDDALTNAMRELVLSPEKRLIMGASSQIRARSYDLIEASKKYEALYLKHSRRH